jgi:hypothetical protein
MRKTHYLLAAAAVLGLALLVDWRSKWPQLLAALKRLRATLEEWRSHAPAENHHFPWPVSETPLAAKLGHVLSLPRVWIASALLALLLMLVLYSSCALLL